MSRIACIWIPDLPLVAHLRIDPDAADHALALIDGRSARRTVVACTAPAAAAGVTCGMTAAQARAVCDAVTVRSSSPAAIGAAVATAADVAATLSARVEIAADLVFLDADGIGSLFGSESEFATVLGARLARQGLPGWIGIADAKLGAAVAARESRGVRIVASGATREFLAPLPLAFLAPDSDTAATLASWGLRSIGDLATLPAGAVAHRLGPAGADLHRRARGTDDVPLVCRPAPSTFVEGLLLDYAIERLEPLLFVLRRLLECVTRRLELQGLGCTALELRFALDGGSSDVRTIPVAAPTTEHKTLLALIHAHLETTPPSQPVVDIVLAARPARLRPVQLDLLRPAGPAPAALAATLARLATLCGADRVGILQPADSHRPDAVQVTPFMHDPAVRSESPGSVGNDNGNGTNGGAAVHMALRAFRPAVDLEVYESRGRLDYVRGAGFGGRVVHAAGPWRVRGDWWTDDAYAREYYDVELSDGGVYRIYRDASKVRWLADGVYD